MITPTQTEEFKPTAEQRRAIQFMDDWYLGTQMRIGALTGVAGSSKTGTMIMWVKERGFTPADIIIATPTTELVYEIEDRLPGFQVQTIYSLLGFRPTATPIEQQMLKKVASRPISAKLVIVEEAFYLSPLLTTVIANCYPDVRWLFVGDPMQLKSINNIGVTKDHISATEILETVPYFFMEENLRAISDQQKQLCKEVRDMDTASPLLQSLVMDYYDALTEAKTYLQQNKSTPSAFLAIAYRHKTINAMADTFRQWLYGFKADSPPQRGELIRVSRTVDSEGVDLVRNHETVEVLEYQPQFMVVKRASGEQVALDLDWNGECDEVKQEAIKSSDPRVWARYHEMSMQFVNVGSRLATTGHSSQGLTSLRGLIDWFDLLSANDRALRYVAISRFRYTPWIF
jgi:AAA domain